MILHILFNMQFFPILLVLSLACAFPTSNPNFQFSPISYFPGSWKMTKEIYSSNAAEEHKIELYSNLNVTVENEKELFFKYFNNETNEMDSTLSFRSLVLDEKAMTFPPFVDVDTNKVVDIHFQTLVANSSYVYIFFDEYCNL